jgi:hypothetical protein
MKSRPVIFGVFTAAILLLFLLSSAWSMDDPGFKIERMVISGKISDLEPVAIGTNFSVATEKVYCFLEARNVEEDTMVSFVWYFNNREMARVSLPLNKSSRWRTYSSKKLGSLKGDWKVELLDSSGIILHSVSFQVQ